jgi:hypothetical protein
MWGSGGWIRAGRDALCTGSQLGTARLQYVEWWRFVLWEVGDFLGHSVLRMVLQWAFQRQAVSDAFTDKSAML